MRPYQGTRSNFEANRRRKPPFYGNGATLHRKRLSRVREQPERSRRTHSSHGSASSGTSSRITRLVRQHTTSIPSKPFEKPNSERTSHPASLSRVGDNSKGPSFRVTKDLSKIEVNAKLLEPNGLSMAHYCVVTKRLRFSNFLLRSPTSLTCSTCTYTQTMKYPPGPEIGRAHV